MSNLLEQGIELMIYGMGTVFVFLAVLVVVTQGLSWLVQRFMPEKAVTVAAKATPAQPADTAIDDQLLAVISAAVKEYRSRHK